MPCSASKPCHQPWNLGIVCGSGSMPRSGLPWAEHVLEHNHVNVFCMKRANRHMLQCSREI